MNKELCQCGKMAVYSYMPGEWYYCDDCISSPEDEGCSCNWYSSEHGELPEGQEGKDWRYVEHPGDDQIIKTTKEDGIWIKLDEKGRPYPCCEYWYNEDGFEIDEE